MSKMKNPFKKASLIDTGINTLVGGAGNVAFDYAWNELGIGDMVTPEDSTKTAAEQAKTASTIKNALKLVGGALVGSMVSNKYARAAANGFAVVGASDLVSGLIDSDTADNNNDGDKTPTSGLPSGTIGRLRAGNRYFSSRRNRVSGLGNPTAFMGK